MTADRCFFSMAEVITRRTVSTRGGSHTTLRHEAAWMAVAAMRESSMCDDVDRALVEALRLREPAAAERLVAAYRRTAYRWAQRVTGQVADAEEVAQDALWMVILKIDTFQGNAPFRSWLYRIVANAA